ncbi:hypothetical protein Bca101_094037 [Brassica carinata]
MNFKKDSKFMGITVLFLDEKMWLDKSNLSKALALAKKQLESLSVSSLIQVFQRMEIPIDYVGPHRIIMCSLNNRLCVSAMKINGIQDMWSLKSDKVWEKTHSLDLSYTTFGEYSGVPLSLVAIFDKTRMLILWQSLEEKVLLLVEDTETQSGKHKLKRDTREAPIRDPRAGNAAEAADAGPGAGAPASSTAMTAVMEAAAKSTPQAIFFISILET